MQAAPRPWLGPIAALALTGCAALPPEIPAAAECRANYLGLDGQVAAAGVRNGGSYAIPGFPYMRANRFLASFRDEADGPQFDAWVGHLRALDLAARESELRNLGWEHPAEELRHLDRCGRDWAARDLADPRRRAALREAAAVPDDYELLYRLLGFYPVAVPLLNLGIDGYHDEVRTDYARPLAELGSPGPLVLWRPAAARPRAADAAQLVAAARRDALGIPQLGAEQWRTLAHAHAPTWQVETGGAFDRIGAPALADGAPAFDASRPVTYFLPAYTRYAGRVLPQLVYVAWFSERPKDGWIDSYAGALDGVVWRVTLDVDGTPLLYDTIHPCGCFHYYYTAKPLERRPQGGFWDEPQLFPQGRAPDEPFAIRVQSRTHFVRRLVPLDEAASDEMRAYAIADYDELLSLPDGRGGRRSLFCEDGLVCGTGRLERFWLWPTGVKSPGGMRQWGRHATSFVGRSHFDDAHLLDWLFEPR